MRFPNEVAVFTTLCLNYCGFGINKIKISLRKNSLRAIFKCAINMFQCM